MNAKVLSVHAPVEGRPMTRSRRVLGSMLAATLVATAWALWQDDRVAVVAPASTQRQAHAEARLGPASTEKSTQPSWPAPPLPRKLLDAPILASAWQPADPVSIVPQPKPALEGPEEPATPHAPPFAYALIGRLDDGQPLALLSGPLRSIAVKAGDTVDGQWRIDAVGEQSVTLTWLPGNISQQIAFKSS